MGRGYSTAHQQLNFCSCVACNMLACGLHDCHVCGVVFTGFAAKHIRQYMLFILQFTCKQVCSVTQKLLLTTGFIHLEGTHEQKLKVLYNGTCDT